MKLIIAHYHLRPGGIRRVIETGAPSILRALGADSVILLVGEPARDAWMAGFQQLLPGVPIECVVMPEIHYFSEQQEPPEALAEKIRGQMIRFFKGRVTRDDLVWLHNPGLARNLLFTEALMRECRDREIPLVAHHHDWWFDYRWQRWPELVACGYKTLARAAKAVFVTGPSITHAAINHEDFEILSRFLPRSGWLPNSAEPVKPIAPARLQAARGWLESRDIRSPSWILPCRMLRRKNMAEALLLTRWLRPEATLVTTGGVSSAQEIPYATALEAAARANAWKIRLSVLAEPDPAAPSVLELMTASEAVLLTSIQEGFGLPYIEATAARRPLLARRLLNVAPDLRQFGFDLPSSYDEIVIDPHLFRWHEERERQSTRFRSWRQSIPSAARSWMRPPDWLESREPVPVPFSRLTLAAQLEILSKPIDLSWKFSGELNPWLREWRSQILAGEFRIESWPAKADQWLSPSAYGERFQSILAAPALPRPFAPFSLQQAFVKLKGGATHSYPLLWGLEP